MTSRPQQQQGVAPASGAKPAQLPSSATLGPAVPPLSNLNASSSANSSSSSSSLAPLTLAATLSGGSSRGSTSAAAGGKLASASVKRPLTPPHTSTSASNAHKAGASTHTVSASVDVNANANSAAGGADDTAVAAALRRRLLLPEVPSHLRPAFSRARAQVARLLKRREAERAQRKQTALLTRLRGGHNTLPPSASASGSDDDDDDEGDGGLEHAADAHAGGKSGGKQAASASGSGGSGVSVWLIVRLLLAGVVVEYVWTVGEILMMPYLLDLGVPIAIANLLWLVNPVFGLVMQPIVGRWTDSCSSPWGRRRPFVLALMLMLTLGYTCIVATPTLTLSDRRWSKVMDKVSRAPPHIEGIELVEYSETDALSAAFEHEYGVAMMSLGDSDGGDDAEHDAASEGGRHSDADHDVVDGAAYHHSTNVHANGHGSGSPNAASALKQLQQSINTKNGDSNKSNSNSSPVFAETSDDKTAAAETGLEPSASSGEAEPAGETTKMLVPAVYVVLTFIAYGASDLAVDLLLIPSRALINDALAAAPSKDRERVNAWFGAAGGVGRLLGLGLVAMPMRWVPRPLMALFVPDNKLEHYYNYDPRVYNDGGDPESGDIKVMNADADVDGDESTSGFELTKSEKETVANIMKADKDLSSSSDKTAAAVSKGGSKGGKEAAAGGKRAHLSAAEARDKFEQAEKWVETSAVHVRVCFILSALMFLAMLTPVLTVAEVPIPPPQPAIENNGAASSASNASSTNSCSGSVVLTEAEQKAAAAEAAAAARAKRRRARAQSRKVVKIIGSTNNIDDADGGGIGSHLSTASGLSARRRGRVAGAAAKSAEPGLEMALLPSSNTASLASTTGAVAGNGDVSGAVNGAVSGPLARVGRGWGRDDGYVAENDLGVEEDDVEDDSDRESRSEELSESEEEEADDDSDADDIVAKLATTAAAASKGGAGIAKSASLSKSTGALSARAAANAAAGATGFVGGGSTYQADYGHAQAGLGSAQQQQQQQQAPTGYGHGYEYSDDAPHGDGVGYAPGDLFEDEDEDDYDGVTAFHTSAAAAAAAAEAAAAAVVAEAGGYSYPSAAGSVTHHNGIFAYYNTRNHHRHGHGHGHGAHRYSDAQGQDWDAAEAEDEADAGTETEGDGGYDEEKWLFDEFGYAYVYDNCCMPPPPQFDDDNIDDDNVNSNNNSNPAAAALARARAAQQHAWEMHLRNHKLYVYDVCGRPVRVRRMYGKTGANTGGGARGSGDGSGAGDDNGGGNNLNVVAGNSAAGGSGLVKADDGSFYSNTTYEWPYNSNNNAGNNDNSATATTVSLAAAKARARAAAARAAATGHGLGVGVGVKGAKAAAVAGDDSGTVALWVRRMLKRLKLAPAAAAAPAAGAAHGHSHGHGHGVPAGATAVSVGAKHPHKHHKSGRDDGAAAGGGYGSLDADDGAAAAARAARTNRLENRSESRTERRRARVRARLASAAAASAEHHADPEAGIGGVGVSEAGYIQQRDDEDGDDANRLYSNAAAGLYSDSDVSSDDGSSNSDCCHSDPSSAEDSSDGDSDDDSEFESDADAESSASASASASGESGSKSGRKIREDEDFDGSVSTDPTRVGAFRASIARFTSLFLCFSPRFTPHKTDSSNSSSSSSGGYDYDDIALAKSDATSSAVPLLGTADGGIVAVGADSNSNCRHCDSRRARRHRRRARARAAAKQARKEAAAAQGGRRRRGLLRRAARALRRRVRFHLPGFLSGIVETIGTELGGVAETFRSLPPVLVRTWLQAASMWYLNQTICMWWSSFCADDVLTRPARDRLRASGGSASAIVPDMQAGVRLATLCLAISGVIVFFFGSLALPRLNRALGPRVWFHISFALQYTSVLLMCLTPMGMTPLGAVLCYSVMGIVYPTLHTNSFVIAAKYYSPEYDTVVAALNQRRATLLAPLRASLHRQLVAAEAAEAAAAGAGETDGLLAGQKGGAGTKGSAGAAGAGKGGKALKSVSSARQYLDALKKLSRKTLTTFTNSSDGSGPGTLALTHAPAAHAAAAAEAGAAPANEGDAAAVDDDREYTAPNVVRISGIRSQPSSPAHASLSAAAGTAIAGGAAAAAGAAGATHNHGHKHPSALTLGASAAAAIAGGADAGMMSAFEGDLTDVGASVVAGTVPADGFDALLSAAPAPVITAAAGVTVAAAGANAGAGAVDVVSGDMSDTILGLTLTKPLIMLEPEEADAKLTAAAAAIATATSALAQHSADSNADAGAGASVKTAGAAASAGAAKTPGRSGVTHIISNSSSNNAPGSGSGSGSGAKATVSALPKSSSATPAKSKGVGSAKIPSVANDIDETYGLGTDNSFADADADADAEGDRYASVVVGDGSRRARLRALAISAAVGGGAMSAAEDGLSAYEYDDGDSLDAGEGGGSTPRRARVRRGGDVTVNGGMMSGDNIDNDTGTARDCDTDGTATTYTNRRGDGLRDAADLGDAATEFNTDVTDLNDREQRIDAVHSFSDREHDAGSLSDYGSTGTGSGAGAGVGGALVPVPLSTSASLVLLPRAAASSDAAATGVADADGAGALAAFSDNDAAHVRSAAASSATALTVAAAPTATSVATSGGGGGGGGLSRGEQRQRRHEAQARVRDTVEIAVRSRELAKEASLEVLAQQEQAGTDDECFGAVAAVMTVTMTLGQCLMGLTAGVLIHLTGSIQHVFTLTAVLLIAIHVGLLSVEYREWRRDENIANELARRRRQRRKLEREARAVQRAARALTKTAVRDAKKQQKSEALLSSSSISSASKGGSGSKAAHK